MKYPKHFFWLCILMLIIVMMQACNGVSGRTPVTSTQSTTATTSTSGTTTVTLSRTTTSTPTFASTTATADTIIPVPAAYQALYDELGSEMSHFESTLDRRGQITQGQTVFATELAFANGNVGEGLLLPSTMQQNIQLLDRLQAMGVEGIVLAIKFPLLKPDFPRSKEYLAFYKNIMAECRKHKMKVLVEAGAIFSGTAYSTVTVDWSKYTTAEFLQGLQDQLLLIAGEIRPDYLTLANEPLTEESLTKLTITPAVWSDFIKSTISKIDRSHGIMVGAGTGTWENPAYIETVMNMPELDYIDLHIYPLNSDAKYLDRALNWSLQAKANGKRVTVSEAWLWKASAAELGSGLGNPETAMNRDVWSFWYPEDARFFQDIMKLADATNMDFVSFFWTRNFFTSLDYARTSHSLSTTAYNRLMNQGALAGVPVGTLSPLGRFYQQQLANRSR